MFSVTLVSWIRSVSRPDGGSAPSDNLNKPQYQQWPRQLETDPLWRPQRHDNHRHRSSAKTTRTRLIPCTIQCDVPDLQVEGTGLNIIEIYQSRNLTWDAAWINHAMLVQLARVELAPEWFLSLIEFEFLATVTFYLALLATHYICQYFWLYWLYYKDTKVNWTELDDEICVFSRAAL